MGFQGWPEFLELCHGWQSDCQFGVLNCVTKNAGVNAAFMGYLGLENILLGCGPSPPRIPMTTRFITSLGSGFSTKNPFVLTTHGILGGGYIPNWGWPFAPSLGRRRSRGWSRELGAEFRSAESESVESEATWTSYWATKVLDTWDGRIKIEKLIMKLMTLPFLPQAMKYKYRTLVHFFPWFFDDLHALGALRGWM